jgi:activator of HSP90 ATPase
MAKTSSKTATKAPAKTASSKAKSSAASTDIVEKATEDALKTLKTLNVEPQLVSDLEWCLGSYRFDKNPSGLFEMLGRALNVLSAEKAKKTKGVTVKLIGDIEKALKVQ